MLACSPRIGFAALLALVFSVVPSVLAQDDPCVVKLKPAQKEEIAIRWKLLELEARQWTLEKEKALYERPPQVEPPANQPPRIPEALPGLLSEAYKKTDEMRREQLRNVREQFDSKEGAKTKMKEAWCNAQAEAALLDDKWKDAEKHYGNRNDVHAPPLWDGETSLITVGGLFLLAASVALYLHGWRRELRRYYRFNGKIAAAVTAALLVGLSGSFVSHSAAQAKADDSPQLNQLRAEHETLKGIVDGLEEEVDKLRDAWLKRLADQFVAKPLEENAFLQQFMKEEKRASKEFRDLMQTAKVVELARANGNKVLAQVDKDREDLKDFKEQRHGRLRWQILIKIVLAGLFLLLAFIPVRRFQRAKRRQQAEQAEQCPCCFDTALQKKTLNSPDERFPEPTYLQCSKCGYEMRATYQKLPRLCFPTVGVPGSGKTHWMVTAYDFIKNVRVPVRASLQCAPSISDMQFDAQIELILENRIGARGTVHDRKSFSFPLVFHAKDCDNLGRSAAMLNLFDFGGEMMKTKVEEDVVRQRALLMDGFVLFLDPTKVKLSKGDDSIKNQIEALKAFQEEIRDMRGVDVGTAIPVPIAVCISKLDLIVTKNPYSRAALPWIASLRESFRKPLTLAEIQKRSKLCEEKMSIIFPGWNLPRVLDEQFGGRFMFFPLTPVSLIEEELGREDLSRGFEPVGILEPILWLLHMHGFDVLK